MLRCHSVHKSFAVAHGSPCFAAFAENSCVLSFRSVLFERFHSTDSLNNSVLFATTTSSFLLLWTKPPVVPRHLHKRRGPKVQSVKHSMILDRHETYNIEGSDNDSNNQGNRSCCFPMFSGIAGGQREVFLHHCSARAVSRLPYGACFS